MRRLPASLPLLAACGVFVAAAVAQTLLAKGQGRTVQARAELPPVVEADPSSGAELDKQKEYRVKAALLFNFLKYATFPKDAFADKDPKSPDPLVVLVVGEDPFGPTLEKSLLKKKVHGRVIKIVRSKKVPAKVDAHLVFAGKLTAKQVDALIAATAELPCMLISEKKGLAKRGTFINFYTSKGKIRFEVNKNRQKDTRVTLAAQLLKLARVVDGKSISKRSGGTPR